MEHGERDGKSLTDAMDQGDLDGMQTFDGVLERYVREGLVKKEDAMAYASNPGNFLLRLSDMGASGAQSRPPANTNPNGTGTGNSMLDMIE
jgi:twitching motility protein PilT